jgi:acetyl-CoA synthetase
LVSHEFVSEAAAIGVPDELKGQSVVCFCVLTPNAQPGNALRETLMRLVADELGKPLMPKDIKFVKDLPKTRNAKVMRRVIRAAYLGLDPGDTSSLENPQAVEEIRQAM